MTSKPEDDLEPESTEGFKVGEKKTIDEYQKLGRYSQQKASMQPISIFGSRQYMSGQRKY